MILGPAVQGQGQDGHIIDGAGLDQWGAHARGNAVKVGLKLLVEPDEGRLDVSADDEADDDQRIARARCGVEVFDPGHLPEQLFHRPGDTILHLGRCRSRHGDGDIHHRHLDLRLLFAGQLKNGEAAEQDRGDDCNGRQLGIDKIRRDPTGQTPPFFGVLAQGKASTGCPSRRVADGVRITVSPAATPDNRVMRPSFRAAVLTSLS